MTLEELLNCSADKLESFTDEQLTEWFAPLLNVTRPELAAKEGSNNIRHPSNVIRQQKAKDAIELEKRMELFKQLAASKGIKI